MDTQTTGNQWIAFTVYITPEQHAGLRLAAYEQQESMAELVRRAVDRFLVKEIERALLRKQNG